MRTPKIDKSCFLPSSSQWLDHDGPGRTPRLILHTKVHHRAPSYQPNLNKFAMKNIKKYAIVNGYTDASFMTDIDDINVNRAMFSSLIVVQWFGRVSNRTLLRILQQKKNILRLQKLRRRQSGSTSLLKRLVWSQVR